MTAIPKPDNIVLFDGICNLCSGAVQFIIKHDPNSVFHFASIQSDYGQKLMREHKLPTDSISTIILIQGGRCFTRSTAALRIARRLSGAYPLIYTAIIVPRILRDAGYRLIARNRYRWFGRKEQCWLPSPELRKRFLD
jgi:predicted DCC family thiol-disulfide oxidoreductase YuxK